MTSYIITIAVDPPGLQYSDGPPSSGNFVYLPARLNVSEGDQITWTCNNPFSLEFQGESPIDNAEVFGTGVNTRSSAYETNACTVTAKKGSFHYAVAVCVTPSGSLVPQVFMDSGCPHIVVN